MIYFDLLAKSQIVQLTSRYLLIFKKQQLHSRSMQSTNRSGLQCSQHPRQQIANFCVSANCLKPLCPDCVQIHTRTNDKHVIQSWKHCVNNAARHTKGTLDQLRVLYEMQRQNKAFKSIEVIQSENVKRLNGLRQKLHKMIDEVFNNHQNALRLHIRNQYKIDMPDTSKLKMAIEETEKVLLKLSHPSSVLPALKKCLLLDHKALIEYFSHLKNNQPKIITQNFFLQNSNTVNQFRSSLERLVSFQSFSIDPPINSTPYNRRGASQYRNEQISSDPFQAIKITEQDYFNNDCIDKFLHFFIPCSQQLKLLKLSQAQRGAWITVNFKSSSQLPSYFKSIITPSGQIYLTGGSFEQNKSNEIFRYNFQKKFLQPVGKMTMERSSHSLCYLNNCIYIIGGFDRSSEVTRDCEIFNISTKVCSKIAPLNTPSANCCSTAFKNDYLFKFGGIYNKSFNENSKIIEMYSVKSNRWIAITIDLPRSIPTLQLLSFSAAVQINESEILVFGGYDNSEMEKPDRICYVLQVSSDKKKFTVKHYNTYPLPYAQAFWDNNPFISQNRVIALQNITDQQDELTAIADDRRVIIFNGERWL